MQANNNTTYTHEQVLQIINEQVQAQLVKQQDKHNREIALLEQQFKEALLLQAGKSKTVKNKKKKFYAVAVGKNPGIYDTWEECEKQVKGFSKAKFKGFATSEDAQQFINNTASESCE
jgi:phosphoribulokinase